MANELKSYNGFDAQGLKVIGLGDPTLADDAVNKRYVDVSLTSLASNSLAEFVGKVRSGVADASLLVIGDSTSADQPNGWVTQSLPSIAAQFPTHTIKVAYWVDGTPGSWGADSTYATGTGSRTIKIWVAAVAGKTWQYHLDITRREAMLAVGADAILVNLGHNEDNSAANTGNMSGERGKVLGQLGEIEQIVETATVSSNGAAYTGMPAMVLMSTNPLLTYASASEYRADMYRKIARGRGYGFIDVNRAFYEDGRAIHTTLVSDGVHPTVAGYGIIAKLFTTALLNAEKSKGFAPFQQKPIFAEYGGNLLTDGMLSNLDASNKPAGWTLNNITATVNTTTFETGSYALTLTKTTDAAGVALVRMSLPTWVRARGGVYTVAARIYVPSGQANVVGQIGFNNGVTTVQGYVWTQYDQWIWKVYTFRFAPGASAAEVRLQVANSVGNLPGTIILDRIVCVEGAFPSDIDTMTELSLAKKVTAPASAAAGRIATFVDTSGTSIQNSGVTVSTDGTFAGSDHFKIPTMEAIRTWVTTTFATAVKTLTNTRVRPRVLTVTPAAVPTYNTDNADIVDIYGLNAAITSMVTNKTGTPTNGDKLMFRIRDDGTARAIAWGADFESINFTLPTTTVINKRLIVGFIYDSFTSKWGCVAVSQEI